MDMISEIRRIYNELPASERKVADFVLKNSKQILNLSVFEVADMCKVSAPSVSRFVKRTFGLNFAETKVELAKGLSKIEKNNVTELLSWADDLGDMPAKIINEITLTCNDVIATNSADKFKEVIRLIKNADTVYFFAVGSSATVAADFQNKLLKIGIKSIFINDSNLNILNSNICTPKDVVIAISFSGRTKEVNIAVSNAKLRKTPVVAITQRMDSNLAEMADHVLLSPSYETNENRLGAIFSRYGQLFIVDYLFVGLAKQVVKNTEEFSESYHKFFENLKE